MSVPTGSLKERQRQERERLILQATSEALAQKGYDAMSMEDIAGRVGISRAAIYLHFPSKEDLVLALIQHGIETSVERLDALLAEHKSPREKVRALIERSYGNAVQSSFQVFSAVMHNPTFFSKAAEKRQAMGDLWKPTTQRLAALLEQGKRSGDFDPDMPTPLMVGLLVVLISPFTKHMFEQEQIPLPVVAENLCRYFLKGVAPDFPQTANDALASDLASRDATYRAEAIDK
jgi:TetR/AcrR family transcriptional regulator, fatty acid metabolism regulator protein